MARGLSFFWRRNCLSSEIRGVQVAQELGAKSNPREGYQDDVSILVKMSPGIVAHDKKITDLGTVYMDVLDWVSGQKTIRRRPEIPLIAASQASAYYLRNKYPNPVTCIPQHHCNYARETRLQSRPVKVVGYIGADHAVAACRDAVTKRVEQMGLEMRWLTDYRTREQVVEFYRGIDIQFAWRGDMPIDQLYLKNTLRLVNAMSFAIPTVAKPEPALVQELHGHFLEAESAEDACELIDQLARDPIVYRQYSTAGPRRSEPYHLHHVAGLYRALTHG